MMIAVGLEDRRKCLHIRLDGIVQAVLLGAPLSLVKLLSWHVKSRLQKNYAPATNKAVKNLSDGMAGIKKLVARKTGRDEGKAQSGMAPVSWELYQNLLKWMLYDIGGKEGLFAHTYCILTWNLCCRTSNTASIHLSHLDMWNDALKIYFAHMKNDQKGEQSQYGRHLYCNPFYALVCPIHALTLYFLAFPAVVSDPSGLLFTGKDPAGRFGAVLGRIKDQFKDEIEETGIKVEHLGVHSLRKGALTFLSSVSTAGPSSSAVHTRAGWARRGEADTYIQYERAVDCYAGRLLCGLNVDSPDFAVLPPKFFDFYEDDFDEKRVDECVASLFGKTTYAGVRSLLYTCAALLVVNFNSITEMIAETPSLSYLGNFPIFKNMNVGNVMHVVYPHGFQEDPGHEDTDPSGIPPHLWSNWEI